MLPGPTIVRECPFCNQLFEHPTEASGNTIGGHVWTDRKPDYPMLTYDYFFMRCPHCHGSFNPERCKVVTVIKPFEAMPDEYRDLPCHDLPEPEDYWRHTDILAGSRHADPLGPEFEMRVRLEALWRGNDRRREPGGGVPPTDRELENMQEIIVLLSARAEKTRLLRAELFRERGEFDHCLALLSEHSHEGSAPLARLIQKLAEELVTEPRMLP